MTQRGAALAKESKLATGQRRAQLAAARTWVVKVGSAVITAHGQGLERGGIAAWCGQVANLAATGKRVALVSSGAIAEGCRRLGYAQRPATIAELQAAAAVGQAGLVEAYQRAFARRGLTSAQVLLTHDDLAHRQRYLNARATLSALLDLGVVPIINENDSVATDEIKLGDNDTLAAQVAGLLAADVLVVLTDRAGLHEADPRLVPDAPLVELAGANDPMLDAMAGGGGRLGRGGMATKLAAARLAARAGTHTAIADGRADDVLGRLARGENLGTLLGADLAPLDARKRWLAGQTRAKGELRVDAGAANAVRRDGVSLLPAGVTAATGTFQRGDLVRVLDADGNSIGQGLTNYAAAETRRILGRRSGDIQAVLGFVAEQELVHRDNLVVW